MLSTNKTKSKIMVSVILIDGPCKDGNPLVTKLPLKPYSDQKCGKTILFLTQRVFTYVSFTILLLINKKCTEKKQYKEKKMLIYNLNLIRQNFPGYRCVSGIVVFAS